MKEITIKIQSLFKLNKKRINGTKIDQIVVEE